MRRADRLFEIIQLLRRRKLTRARDLAEKLGVSERTIYRDVRDLMARWSLPERVPATWNEGEARRLLVSDKKRRGDQITVPRLRAPGEVTLEQVTPDALLEAVRTACQGT